MKTIYKVYMSTSNHSADKSGMFSTREKANAEIKKWRIEVARSPEYYGPTEFEIKEIEIDINLD